MAVRIEDASGHRRTTSTRRRQAGDRRALLQAAAEARQSLEETVMVLAMAAYRALTYAQRLDEALAGLSETGGSDSGSGRQPILAPSRLVQPEVALSPREQEVLALVAEGYSNKAIATALFVSPNTVKTHVTSLLTKLGADSRVQLAAIATRQELHRRAASSALSELGAIAGTHSRPGKGEIAVPSVLTSGGDS